jgi:hypothetical protein
VRSALLSLVLCLALVANAALAADADVERLEREIAELRAVVRALESRLETLAIGGTTHAAPPPSGDDALDRALREAEAAQADGAGDSRAMVPSAARGPASLRLIDISLDTITSAGGSSASDAELLFLQGGEHDPRQRGFSLNQVELGFKGAVDPYLTGEAYLVYFLDGEGESHFELEEAFATTQALPYDLQLDFGHFFTRFGRMNPTHPHAWAFVDQPVILTRLFGGDGIRNPGMRLSWLAPTPWFAELSLGSQLASGETMVSFLANDEVFSDRPIGGLAFQEREVHGLSDLVWLARLANGFDVGDEWTSMLGFSGLWGPNASGRNATTQIWGVDAMAKWRPAKHRRGWPFVLLEGEWMYRRYETDERPDTVPTLRDWGGYGQALFGFRERWATGFRAEYANSGGDGVIRGNDDPFRQARLRLSPLVSFYQSEFARWRLQYNYDRSRFLDDSAAHSLWLVLEFGFGAHPAHEL